jgi:hypothetical protein
VGSARNGVASVDASRFSSYTASVADDERRRTPFPVTPPLAHVGAHEKRGQDKIVPERKPKVI